MPPFRAGQQETPSMPLCRALPKLRTPLLLALLSLAGAVRAHAVTVSPTAVFIDARSPTATLSLYNNGTAPEEVEISFGFGYPSSNAEGELQVQIQDSAAAGEPSVVPWLRAFPRRLQLQPGQRQTLRVMVQAPAGTADGEYWGRVLVRSRGGQPPIESTQGQVHVALNVETVVATAVLFRKGPVTTGAAVRSASASLAGDSVRFTVDLDRQGNAVYLGRVQARLRDASGRVVGSAEDALALYRSLRRRFAIALPAGASRAGLTVEYVVDTERPDLPPAGPLKAPPVTGTVPVR
jgi:P pilus assembly chaperone PapD